MLELKSQRTPGPTFNQLKDYSFHNSGIIKVTMMKKAFLLMSLYKKNVKLHHAVKANVREKVLFSRTDFLPWEILLVKMLDFEKTKPT